jgi:DNA polymerase-3 subunit alpha
MGRPFVHLHTHSEYSMLQSTARIAELVKQATLKGQTALALTDHGNMFGMLEFHNAAKKAGLKALLGCDFYVAPDRRQNQSYPQNQPIHHKLILIAATDAGYKNLLKLCSEAYLNGYYQKPRIDHEYLKECSEGLICLTSNYQGEVGFQIAKGNDKRARELLAAYAGYFGKDNVYLCVQDHGVAEEAAVNRKFLEWHRSEGWQLVAVNDVHYLEKTDAEAHEVMLCIESGHRYHRWRDGVGKPYRAMVVPGKLRRATGRKIRRSLSLRQETRPLRPKLVDPCLLEKRLGRWSVPVPKPSPSASRRKAAAAPAGAP